jgi:hypothetical protein
VRVYTRTSAAVALELLERGFQDLHTDAGQDGVWCADSPPGDFRPAAGTGVMLGGPEGDTVLCTDVPEDVFRELEMQESTRSLTMEEAVKVREGDPWPEGLEYQSMGYAIIPADTLNRYGRPRLYDHEYAGYSRADLIRATRALGEDEGGEVTRYEAGPDGDPVYAGEGPETGPDPAGRRRLVQEMRDAVEFFDRVGWRTPLRLREEADQGQQG